jgi:hypothetical protein
MTCARRGSPDPAACPTAGLLLPLPATRPIPCLLRLARVSRPRRMRGARLWARVKGDLRSGVSAETRRIPDRRSPYCLPATRPTPSLLCSARVIRPRCMRGARSWAGVKGDLRSGVSAGSGDPRRARPAPSAGSGDPRRAQTRAERRPAPSALRRRCRIHTTPTLQNCRGGGGEQDRRGG